MKFVYHSFFLFSLVFLPVCREITADELAAVMVSLGNPRSMEEIQVLRYPTNID
jgi:hypothetical protein